jgi:hypothetical protein
MPVLQKAVSRASRNLFRYSVLLIDSFHELSDDEWHALDSLDLLLRSDELTFQTPGTHDILALV